MIRSATDGRKNKNQVKQGAGVGRGADLRVEEGQGARWGLNELKRFGKDGKGDRRDDVSLGASGREGWGAQI